MVGNWFEYYVSVAFLWVFVVVRVVGYGGVLIVLMFDLKLVEDNYILYFVWVMLYVFMCCGFVFNVVWTYKIYGMVKYFRRKTLK